MIMALNPFPPWTFCWHNLASIVTPKLNNEIRAIVSEDIVRASDNKYLELKCGSNSQKELELSI